MNCDLGCGKVYPPEFTPSLANMEAAQYCPMGSGRGGCWEGCWGSCSTGRENDFWNGDFSLFKSLHRKYRFVKFWARQGGAKNGSKVLGKPTIKIPSSHFLTNMEAHFTLFGKDMHVFLRRSPQNQVYPPEFTPSLANMEAAQYCPMGSGRGGCWEGCWG